MHKHPSQIIELTDCYSFALVLYCVSFVSVRTKYYGNQHSPPERFRSQCQL